MSDQSESDEKPEAESRFEFGKSSRRTFLSRLGMASLIASAGPITPCLDAWWAARPAIPIRPAIEEFGLTWCPCGTHLGTHEAQVRKGFIASEKVDQLHLVSLAWIHRFQSRKPLIDRKRGLG